MNGRAVPEKNTSYITKPTNADLFYKKITFTTDSFGGIYIKVGATTHVSVLSNQTVVPGELS